MTESSVFEKKLTYQPDFYALCRQFPEFFPAALNSHSLHEKTGRYSILFAAPEKKLTAFNATELSLLLNAVNTRCKQTTSNAPFDYGWFIYLAYEAALGLEPKFSDLAFDNTQPLAVAIHCQGSLVIDHMTQQVSVFASDAWVGARILEHINMASAYMPSAKMKGFLHAPDKSRFIDNVNTAKNYIRSGDIYQANLSQQWIFEADRELFPTDVYYHLSQSNPAPFAGLLQLSDFSVISSSPERLVRLENGVLQTRPIAGTRPRSKDSKLDLALIDELLNHPKERAEHIMLIDLQRNDLGRVCISGSVEVDELMVIESYQRVHHIVSNVIGRIQPKATMREVISSLFPGGTITGCPKIRCMQIIDELEAGPRGAYTGSFGYINSVGNMDMNILIRTMTLRNSNTLSMHAGAGIVYDSVAEKEHAETEHKIQALLDAL